MEYQPTIYMSELGEIDRNFFQNEDQAESHGHRPMFSEYMLAEMARYYLEGKTISLGNLHRIVVDLQLGMGARLMYCKWNGPGQPPTDVFESADGNGVELNTFDFFQSLQTLNLDNPDPMLFEMQKAELRVMLAAFLSGTAEPSFERLFAGILTLATNLVGLAYLRGAGPDVLGTTG